MSVTERTRVPAAAVIVSMMILAGCGLLLSSGYAAADEIWDGNAATEFAGGTGTEDDPYVIENGGHLAYLAYVVNNNEEDNDNGGNYNDVGKYYALADHICLNDTSDRASWDDATAPSNQWTPIFAFDANFCGNGYAVKGVYVNGSEMLGGLFGFVKKGSVTDTGIEESWISGGVGAGGIAGQNNGTIDRCYNAGNVKGGENGYAGGIAGANRGNITNCYNSGNVEGDGTYCAGGITGNSENGSIINCYNTGGVSGGENAYVGGIAGFNNSSEDGNALIANCFSTGNVTGNKAGGVAGWHDGTAENNYFLQTGEINSGLDGIHTEDPLGASSDIYDFDENGVINGTAEIDGYTGTSDLIEALNNYAAAMNADGGSLSQFTGSGTSVEFKEKIAPEEREGPEDPGTEGPGTQDPGASDIMIYAIAAAAAAAMITAAFILRARKKSG